MSLKLNILGRRRPGTTLAEHRYHIRQVHGARVLEYIQVDAEHAPRRYVQNVVVDGRYRGTSPAEDPLALNRDFVTQIWVPDLQALQRSRQTAFYNTWLKDDEDNFVDQDSVIFLPSHERVIQDRQKSGVGAWKLFVAIQRGADVDAQTFEQAWTSAARDAMDVVPLKHVQNQVLAVPGRPMRVDGIDEFWFEAEAQAHAHLVSWDRWLKQRLMDTGLMGSARPVALIAREDVVYAGAAQAT